MTGEDNAKSAVIVVYSRDGTGETVAAVLADRLHAEVVTLTEKRRRRGVFGFVGAGFQASRGIASTLTGDPWSALPGRRELHVVGPIWASRMTPAVRAFLIGVDLSGVTVHSVVVQADPNVHGADETHSEMRTLIERAGGTAGRTVSIQGASPGKRASRSEIETRLPPHLFDRGSAG